MLGCAFNNKELKQIKHEYSTKKERNSCLGNKASMIQ
jgi:hypothetical protein